MDAATIRADFPEFADITKYPTATINFWLSVAALVLLPGPWGDQLGVGTELFVCHQLAVQRRNIVASASGGVPGQVTGATTNKTVDKVSVGYSASQVVLTDGGFWNLTTYGIQFLQMARLVGMQAAQQINTPGYPYLGVGYGGGYIL